LIIITGHTGEVILVERRMENPEERIKRHDGIDRQP
jgi:hypothetical protein